MLSSGVTIAINPAQWFGDPIANTDEITDEEIDALGLELGYSGDQALQFCSTNEYAMSNELSLIHI